MLIWTSDHCNSQCHHDHFILKWGDDSISMKFNEWGILETWCSLCSCISHVSVYLCNPSHYRIKYCKSSTKSWCFIEYASLAAWHLSKCHDKLQSKHDKQQTRIVQNQRDLPWIVMKQKKYSNNSLLRKSNFLTIYFYRHVINSFQRNFPQR